MQLYTKYKRSNKKIVKTRKYNLKHTLATITA